MSSDISKEQKINIIKEVLNLNNKFKINKSEKKDKNDADALINSLNNIK